MNLKTLNPQNIIDAYHYAEQNKLPFIKGYNNTPQAPGKFCGYTAFHVLYNENNKYEYFPIKLRHTFNTSSNVVHNTPEKQNAQGRLSFRLTSNNENDKVFNEAVMLIYKYLKNHLVEIYNFSSGKSNYKDQIDKYLFIITEVENNGELKQIDPPIMRLKLRFKSNTPNGDIDENSLPIIKDIVDLSKTTFTRGNKPTPSMFDSEQLKYKNINDTIPINSLIVATFRISSICKGKVGYVVSAEINQLLVNSELCRSNIINDLDDEELISLGVKEQINTDESIRLHSELMKEFEQLQIS